MDETELQKFSFSMLAAPTADVQGSVMITLFGMLEHERAGNDQKARLARSAGVMFIIGLAGVAVLAVVLGLSGTG
ncbi:MAG: hypothetical protein JO206_14345 [Solirubrobacterales bacterium]|nr:hypothetical protein [Solirubrobacterales bacterium]